MKLHASVTVRTAEAADIPVLASHRSAMFRDMGKLSPELEDPLQRATIAYLRDAIVNGEYLAWVA